MSGWTDELAAEHYRKLKMPPPDLANIDPGKAQTTTDLISWSESKPAPLRYVITSAPRTKKNSLRRLKRGNRTLSIPSAAYCAWHERALGQAYRIKAEMAAAGMALPIASRVTVVAVFYQDANRRADECGYMQALGDWLQDVGIVLNDYLIHWDGVEIRVDRAHPRIEFGVTL